MGLVFGHNLVKVETRQQNLHVVQDDILCSCNILDLVSIHGKTQDPHVVVKTGGRNRNHASLFFMGQQLDRRIRELRKSDVSDLESKNDPPTSH